MKPPYFVPGTDFTENYPQEVFNPAKTHCNLLRGELIHRLIRLQDMEYEELASKINGKSRKKPHSRTFICQIVQGKQNLGRIPVERFIHALTPEHSQHILGYDFRDDIELIRLLAYKKPALATAPIAVASSFKKLLYKTILPSTPSRTAEIPVDETFIHNLVGYFKTYFQSQPVEGNMLLGEAYILFQERLLQQSESIDVALLEKGKSLVQTANAYFKKATSFPSPRNSSLPYESMLRYAEGKRLEAELDEKQYGIQHLAQHTEQDVSPVFPEMQGNLKRQIKQAKLAYRKALDITPHPDASLGEVHCKRKEAFYENNPTKASAICNNALTQFMHTVASVHENVSGRDIQAWEEQILLTVRKAQVSTNRSKNYWDAAQHMATTARLALQNWRAWYVEAIVLIQKAHKDENPSLFEEALELLITSWKEDPRACAHQILSDIRLEPLHAFIRGTSTANLSQYIENRVSKDYKKAKSRKKKALQ